MQTLPAPLSSSNPYCDVCQITDILLEHNWTLAFSGDSMMRQTYSGFECALYRRPDLYKIIERKQENWPHRPIDDKSRYGIINTIKLTVQHQQEDPAAENRTTSIFFYAQYKPREDNEEVCINYCCPRDTEHNIYIHSHILILPWSNIGQQQMMYIVNNIDIVVFDHGLHNARHPNAIWQRCCLFFGIRHQPPIIDSS
jgi:hypothetical protein